MINYLRYISISLLLSACSGSNGAVGGADGNNGAEGKSGSNGTNGSDGVNGKDGTGGANGKDGNNGTNGKDGKNGADSKISSTWTCNAKFTNVPVIRVVAPGQEPMMPLSGEFSLWYHAADTSFGDFFARGGVDAKLVGTGSYGTFFVGSEQSTEFWAANTWLASNGYVALTQNLCASGLQSIDYIGYWEFKLDRVNRAVIITYNDTDIVNGKLTFNIQCQ